MAKSGPKPQPLLAKIKTGSKFSPWVIDHIRDSGEPIGPSLEQAYLDLHGLDNDKLKQAYCNRLRIKQ